MKLKPYLLTAMLALSAPLAMEAKQPYGGCWHPDDIKDWSPETDPDAKFNRARVPLADRFREPQTMRANENQFYEGQVCNATILYPTCSGCPSQGANNFLGYQPTYWQYMDKLVYWAGSASEGIIIPPPAGSIDAAHQAGVKVLGQIFFPPPAFGGNGDWVYQMLTKEDGKYIYAIKLYEIAKYMGFDGWFINQESIGNMDSEWVPFFKDFYAAAEADGNFGMELQWYNFKQVPSIEILKTNKNTSHFIEYGTRGDFRQYADEIGCTEAEIFSKVYAGIECVRRGLTGYQEELDFSFPATGHVGSIDLFCPEEHSWKDNVKNYLGTANECGEKAYEAIQKTFANEELVWVNGDGDPSQLATGNWKGLSGHVVERSAITSMPFVSDMCVGVGKHRFVEGEKKGTQDWYHSGVQSVLPTWRWWFDKRGDLKVSIDWDDAYNFGSSFKISGKLVGTNLLRLYKTMIPVENGGTVRVTYKTNGSTPNLRLSTESNITPDQTLMPSTTTEKNGWMVSSYDLSVLNGKTIYMIGLDLIGANDDFTFSLGQIALLPAIALSPVEVKNAEINAELNEAGGDIRLTWDFDWSDDFDRFDIYYTDSKGRRMVGQTRDEAFYIPEFTRDQNDQVLEVEIIPVMKDGTAGTPTVLTAEYSVTAEPSVMFKPGKSYLAIGETTTLAFNATGNPTQVKWTLPEGLQLVSGALTDEEITVKAVSLGMQEVSLAATNNIGTSVTTANLIEVFTAESAKSVYNVVLHKDVHSFSGCANDSESPTNIIDGDTNPLDSGKKWCNTAPESWVIFDTKGLYKIFGFRIYDCKSGPEGGENINNYTIELSEDCENWTTVVREKECQGIKLKEDFIAPMTARYIRLNARVRSTLRIWEFEALGIDNVNMSVETEPSSIKLAAGEEGEIVVRYDFNGDDRADNFKCMASSLDRSLVSVGTIAEDEDASAFIIPVTAGTKIGESSIAVRIDNGTSYVERSVRVTVDVPDAANVLAGMKSEVRHYGVDYSPTADFTKYEIDGLTDGKTAECALEQAIDTPSTHVDDLWAIFESADKPFNLAKVKVFLPYANKAENDNGVQGFVNNQISIAVGDNLASLTRVKTFDNLEEVSELEYIFPSAVKTRYIAIICNLNVYFYPALAEVEAYEQTENTVEISDGPIAMQGWTMDIVAEATPAKDHTTQAFRSSYAFYSANVQEDGALCDADGLITTNSGTSYKIDLAANNSILAQGSGKELTFVEPVSCTSISILATRLQNFGDPLDVTLVYSDGTMSTESFEIESYNSSAPAALSVSQIDRKSDDISGRCSLYEMTLTAEPEKVLSKIGFKTNFDKYQIIGVSGKGKLSGITLPLQSEKTAREIAGYYNLQGMEVKNPTNGIYIVRYSDGSSAKVHIR